MNGTLLSNMWDTPLKMTYILPLKSSTSINEVIGYLIIYTNGQKQNKTKKQKTKKKKGFAGFVKDVAFEPGHLNQDLKDRKDGELRRLE